MKRCTRILLLLAALTLIPCAAFAAPENAAPASAVMPHGPEGAPAVDPGPAADPAFEPAEIMDGENAPVPEKRLTLGERLSLQNAVCILWVNARKQEPAPVEALALMDAEAPEHIFISPDGGFYYENGEWIFEGLIRQMAPGSDGIEEVSAIQYFNVRFKTLENGNFSASAIHFADVGAY